MPAQVQAVERIRVSAGRAAAVALALLLTGCGAGRSSAPVAAREDASRPVAPNFAVPTIAGSTFSLNGQRGKVTVMYFMAAWCTDCYPEARALADLYPKYRDKGVEMVALDVQAGEGPSQLDAFRRRAGSGAYVWAFDSGLHVAEAYGVTALDHTVVVDRQGRVAFHDKRSDSREKLEQEISSLL